MVPTIEEEIDPEPVGEGRLVAEFELVGEWEMDVPEELMELVLCLPIRMFSTVKLEMALPLVSFCVLTAAEAEAEARHVFAVR